MAHKFHQGALAAAPAVAAEAANIFNGIVEDKARPGEGDMGGARRPPGCRVESSQRPLQFGSNQSALPASTSGRRWLQKDGESYAAFGGIVNIQCRPAREVVSSSMNGQYIINLSAL